MAYVETQTFTSVARPAMSWARGAQDEKMALIRAAWERDTTSAQIAARISKMIGSHIGRQCVIGFYSRNRVELAATPLRAVTESNRHVDAKKMLRNPQPRDERSKIIGAKPPLPVKYFDATAPQSREVRFQDLSRFECQWETANADRAADFRFCGLHAPDGPFCAYHHNSAVTAPVISKALKGAA